MLLEYRPWRSAVPSRSWLGLVRIAGVASVLSILPVTAVPAQAPGPPVQGDSVPGDADPEVGGASSETTDPYELYEAGRYDRALEGFLEEQVRSPDDPRVQLNLGNAYYRQQDFESAARSWERAATAEDPELRAEALYNLGNADFRRGQLESAIENYRQALDVDPEDVDAKYNLEFVQQELERRRQQSQQQRGQQGDEDPEEQGDQDRSDQQQGEGQEDQSGDPQEESQDSAGEGEQQDDSEGTSDEGSGDQGERPPQERPDSDRDGLPDDVEQQGENPTDPRSPDSDRDGLSDGQEDRNANGRVDPGETDPNSPDTDRDGIPDAQEAPPSETSSGGAESTAALGQPEGMTPEEAARYLDALEEGRPDQEREPRGGRRTRSGKDW